MDLGSALLEALRVAVGVQAAAYAIAAVGLNLHFGFAGLLNFGHVASALVGAGRMIGEAASPLLDALLDEPRLRESFDRSTGRRRSCCLFYRAPSGGGVCGDCMFPSPPPV